MRGDDMQRLADVTRQFVARSESVLLLAQGVWVIASAYTDRYVGYGRWILLAIGVGHLAGAGLAARWGGPFTRGGGWKYLWVGGALVMAPIVAALLPFGEYGANPTCVQMCGYPVPTIVLLAFYPWVSAGARLLRDSIGIGIVGLFALVPIVLIGRTHEYLTRDNVASWIVTGSLYAVAFLAGRTIGRMCQTATTAQVEAGIAAERDSTRRAYNTLHDEIEHALDTAVLHHESGNTERVGQSLRRIKEIIVRERTRSLLVIRDQVSVATLVSLQVRLVEGVIPTVHVGQVGHVTVRSETAELLNSALAALLKNVVRHSGARTVWLDVGVGSELLHMDVRDDGVGLRVELLDDPERSLHGLRERIRSFGGELLLVPAEAGTHLQVWLPLDPPELDGAG